MSGHIHNFSVSHSHVFLLNSRLGHFSAPYLHRDPFSRSYGVILPSSLAMDHSSTFGFSPRLPVSVCGTGHNILILADFLGSRIRNAIRSPVGSRYYQVRQAPAINLQPIPTPFNPAFRRRAVLSLLRRPIAARARAGILTGCPSASPFG